jgi:hypothetical protein
VIGATESCARCWKASTPYADARWLEVRELIDRTLAAALAKFGEQLG